MHAERTARFCRGRVIRLLAIATGLPLLVQAGWLAGLLRAGPAGTGAGKAADGTVEQRATMAAVGNPLIVLLRDPAVHAELSLDAGQVEAIEAAIAEVDTALWVLRDVPPEESGEEVNSLIGQVAGRLPSVLNAAQRDRLEQLVVQAQGLAALTLPATAAHLRLTAVQQRRIEKILTATQGKIDKLRKTAAGKPSQQQADEAARIRAAERGQIMAVFTNPQKQRLAAMVGKPFDFARVRQLSSKAPELRDVDEWIHTEPLTMEDLRGKVVALHFWAFG